MTQPFRGIFSIAQTPFADTGEMTTTIAPRSTMRSAGSSPIIG